MRPREQAATALETNLTNLESRLDALLAAFEANEQSDQDGAAASQKADETTRHGTSNREKESSGSNEAAKKA
ncbi:hypothetical protein ColLi_06914 [Colletotrichum liriopes]|uniref:Uncharacterized protein n=1 Tax=Colletotrichum liriopes TaxID=708192 RepID=A0AA37GN29_9PEZI|nr:hypothetical protein ColLi_06914 [Colletotrichum liriopes]